MYEDLGGLVRHSNHHSSDWHDHGRRWNRHALEDSRRHRLVTAAFTIQESEVDELEEFVERRSARRPPGGVWR